MHLFTTTTSTTITTTSSTTQRLFSFQLHQNPLYLYSLSLLKPHLFSTPFTSPLSTSSSKMEEAEASPMLLVLCGKSNEENELAKRLVEKGTLKLPDSSPVSVRLVSEMDETHFPKDAFRSTPFFGALSTQGFGRFLIYSPRLTSTHDVVSHNFQELPLGAVCVADTQIKGRGRTQNVWESPKGCLLFSFALQMENGRVLPFLQYVVSLAMTEAIKIVCQQKGMPHLDVKIKWPNDLYLDGLKVGGVLCTSTYRSKKFDVSAGIGLNVGNEKPTTCLNTVAQRLSSSACQFRREDIIAAFFNEFENFYKIFINEGFQPFEELYYKTWLHSGQRVIVEDGETDSVVTIQGVTSTGYLLAISEDGQRCELHPDGNSFDFFKGLVRRKLA